VEKNEFEVKVNKKYMCLDREEGKKRIDSL